MEHNSFVATCSICGDSTRFERGDGADSRESYPCPSCHYTLRWRDQASIIVDEFGRGQALSLRQMVKDGFLDNIVIFEPALRGPFVKYFKGLPYYTQSYYQTEIGRGEMMDDNVRNEDLTNLTFEDNSFDLIISSDVMEHIFDIRTAFSEILRVLRPGGIHIFSIPNNFPFPATSSARVEMRNGKEVHIKPACYHNSGNGSQCLVYTDYGADLSDLISGLGGKLSVVRRSSALQFCHSNATFVMRKVAGLGNRQPTMTAVDPLKSLQGDSSSTLPVLQCPICGGNTFEDFNGRINARCSSCGGVERNRMMWMLLDRLGGLTEDQRVLHMAPELGLARKLHDLSGSNYHAVDVDAERYKSQIIEVRKLDLCKGLIDIPDNSYDLIIHSHVLEHLPCDVEGVLRELDRILAPGGLHMMAVPVRGTTTVEDLSPDLSGTERLKRFGQEDHIRIFGRESLLELLHKVWGDHKHLIEPIEIFTQAELRKAVIPSVAWRGITSHSVFHYRKETTPPAVELAMSSTAQTDRPERVTLVQDDENEEPEDTLELIGMDSLRRDNPWPDFPYGEHAPFQLALDCNGDGGREIIHRQIHEHDVTLMAEVGCFLGGSALHWLQSKTDLTVIGVDPWANSWAKYIQDMAKDANMSRHLAHLSDQEIERIIRLLRTYGNFGVAMNNLRLFKDRFIPVRRYSPEALKYLADKKIPLQLIYIDAFKHRDDLDAAHSLFPDALLCGDDWLWPDQSGELVMQKHIKGFAFEHGFEIEHHRQSWVLHPKAHIDKKNGQQKRINIEYKNFAIEESDIADFRKKSFTQLLRHLDINPDMKIVDLGAGHCMFSKIAAENGLKVTAVDGRTERVPAPKDLAPVEFIQSDIRDFNLSGYDVIMIFGLFYHLEIADQIKLLKRSYNAHFVIIDTQVHIPEMVNTPHPDRFSELVETGDGYQGVVCTEFDNLMASIANKTSFWHTEQSMLKLIQAAGYTDILVVDPPYQSMHGGRRFYVLRGAHS